MRSAVSVCPTRLIVCVTDAERITAPGELTDPSTAIVWALAARVAPACSSCLSGTEEAGERCRGRRETRAAPESTVTFCALTASRVAEVERAPEELDAVAGSGDGERVARRRE